MTLLDIAMSQLVVGVEVPHPYQRYTVFYQKNVFNQMHIDLFDHNIPSFILKDSQQNL